MSQGHEKNVKIVFMTPREAEKEGQIPPGETLFHVKMDEEVVFVHQKIESGGNK